MNNNINNENNNTNPIQVPTTPVVQTTPVQVPTTPVAQISPVQVPATPVAQTSQVQVPTTPVAQTSPIQVPSTPEVQTAPIEISSMPLEDSTTTEQNTSNTIQITQTATPNQNTTTQTPQEPTTNINNTTQQNDKNVLQYVPIILLILVLVLGGYVGGTKITSLISKNKNENENEIEDKTNTNKKEQTNTNNSNNNENNTNNNIENKPNNNTENTNNNQNNEQQENNTNQTCATPTTWNGVYTNGEHSVTLYQNEPNEITYSVKIGTHFITGIADEITGNKASGEIFETHTFELCNDTLTFTTTDEDISTTIFTKNKDYTQNDFFADTDGDPAFLNTEINGIFKKGTTTLKLFQTSATSASVTIIDNNSYFGKTLNITNNTLSYEDDFFDEIQKINITISGNTLTLTASSTDQESYLNSYSGTYTKESSYTMEQIIKDN